jgi:integrase/recombinase XerD
MDAFPSDVQTERLYKKLGRYALGSTVISFLDYLKDNERSSANTRLAYGRDLKQFAEFCNNNAVGHISQVGSQLIQEYLVALQKNERSHASVYRAFISIKVFLEYWRTEHSVSENFGKMVKQPKLWRHAPIPSPYKPEAIDKLLNAPQPFDTYFFRDKVILLLLYATGMRSSELAAVQNADVNVKKGTIKYCRDDLKIKVMLSKPVISAIRKYLYIQQPRLQNEFSGKHFLLSRTGRPLGRIEFWRIVKKYAVRAGLPKTFATDTLYICSVSHFGK